MPSIRLRYVLLIAFAMGIVTALTNVWPQTRAASYVLNAGWVWGAIGILAGLARTTPVTAGLDVKTHARRLFGAARAGVLACGVACLAYVGVELIVNLSSVPSAGTLPSGFSPASPWREFAGQVAVWSVISLITGPVLGVLGGLCRAHGPLGLLARLSIPVGALIEMIWMPRWDPSEPTVRVVQIVVLVAATLGAVLVLQSVRRDRVQVGQPG